MITHPGVVLITDEKVTVAGFRFDSTSERSGNTAAAEAIIWAITKLDEELDKVTPCEGL
jgi:hypothetical protein